jgi:YbgC/YbaW family acyl-CoA thioester hydrolase
MSTLIQEPESKMKIRFPDCDPFNHLNNSRYIDYLINAREDQLLDYYDFDVYRLALEQGIGWVSAQTQISYLFPAMLMEEVTIQTRLLDAGDKSLLLEALMWNREKTRLKAVMWAKLVHYNLKTRSSQPHSTVLMDFFAQVVHPFGEDTSFEDRVRQLKSA